MSCLFSRFDLWGLRWSHWRILCHCSQSKRFLLPLAQLSICPCGRLVVSRNQRTNGKLGCWPVFLSKTTSGSRFRHWLFITWLPAYPCGPVPHYAEGRHLGPPVEATYVSMLHVPVDWRIANHHSNLSGAGTRESHVMFSIIEFELTSSVKVTVNSPLSTNTFIQSPVRKKLTSTCITI